MAFNDEEDYLNDPNTGIDGSISLLNDYALPLRGLLTMLAEQVAKGRVDDAAVSVLIRSMGVSQFPSLRVGPHEEGNTPADNQKKLAGMLEELAQAIRAQLQRHS